MIPRPALSTVLLIAVLVSGCASTRRDGASAVAIDLARTRPLGDGPSFRPPPLGNPAVSAGAPVGSLRCGAAPRGAYGAHVELFAYDHGIAVPAGIGIAPPQRREGAVVSGGSCEYPLRTTDPTGVVEVASGAGPVPTVGELFDLWGQPLSAGRLGAVRAMSGDTVVAFVNGRRWGGDPRRIPLRRHAQIVLELGPFVEPHPVYGFPPSL